MNILDQHSFVMEFVQAWKRGFYQILSQAGLESPAIENLDAQSCESIIAQLGSKRRFITLSGGGRLNGLTLITSEPEALQLAQALMAEPVSSAAEFGEKYRAAVAEFIRQTAEHVRSLSGSAAGDKIGVSFAAPERSDAGAICGGLRIVHAKLPALTIVLVASSELADSIQSPAEESHATAAQAAKKDPIAPASNLDLLFDVKLDATIRFGERKLLLRDVLQMGPGSVIELDRQITEPADLLVAGRLVARGEVVVVNGSFGLRVTELVSSGQNANFLQA